VLTVGEYESVSLIWRDFAQEADEEKRVTDLFWFTSLPALSLEQPEKILLDDIWTTAVGKRGSVF
jgi:hypothetical protein